MQLPTSVLGSARIQASCGSRFVLFWACREAVQQTRHSRQVAACVRRQSEGLGVRARCRSVRSLASTWRWPLAVCSSPVRPNKSEANKEAQEQRKAKRFQQQKCTRCGMRASVFCATCRGVSSFILFFSSHIFSLAHLSMLPCQAMLAAPPTSVCPCPETACHALHGNSTFLCAVLLVTSVRVGWLGCCGGGWRPGVARLSFLCDPRAPCSLLGELNHDSPHPFDIKCSSFQLIERVVCLCACQSFHKHDFQNFGDSSGCTPLLLTDASPADHACYFQLVVDYVGSTHHLLRFMTGSSATCSAGLCLECLHLRFVLSDTSLIFFRY
jgi:hypothetical protein